MNATRVSVPNGAERSSARSTLTVGTLDTLHNEKIYVAGPMADVGTVKSAQSALVAAGHELTLDWTSDLSFGDDYASQPERSAQLASEELSAVMTADAVLVIASQHDGRGMFVELGAALSRAHLGELEHVILVGDVWHESVFYSILLCSTCPLSMRGLPASADPAGRPVLKRLMQRQIDWAATAKHATRQKVRPRPWIKRADRGQDHGSITMPESLVDWGF